MYSVEDLLISHGYKLPSSSSSAAPTPTPDAAAASSSSSHPSKRLDVLGTTVNGYERDVYGSNGGSSSRPSTGCRVAFSNNNNEACRDRDRDRGETGRQEVDGRNQGDTHSLGESLTSDSGFCDAPRGPPQQQAHPQASKQQDVAYWRRRGQDFTVLLDYADFREPPGGGGGGGGPGGGGEYVVRQAGPQQARGQEMPASEEQQRQRVAQQQERHRWAAQAAQAQAQAQARSREREAALHQWRMAAERKCQSLGTEEWRPAVSFGRQLSESDWGAAKEQQRLHTRTPEGMVVHPRAKAKSQSLPRMALQPDCSLQYVDIPSAGPPAELYRRVNGHPISPHDMYRVPSSSSRWPENGRPASATQLSVTPKPRFTRPPRPPSYEVHQQIRGSCEVLSGSTSGRDSAVPQVARDRTPLPLSRAGDPQLDYYSADSGPPGYIPPPSYKRAPVMPGGHRGYGEIPVNYRYRGDVYQQMHMVPDGSHWYGRYPTASLWPDPRGERSVPLPSRKQLYPGYAVQERPGGGVQYIPFDDPRVRHISSALGGNSLTDADKIRHIRNNELPSVTVSEPCASDDSAFLPPPLGPFVAAKQQQQHATHEAHKTSSSGDFDNDNDRWHSDLHKETVDNFPAATDQNCNRYSKNQGPPLPSPSPMSAFTATVVACSSSSVSRQGSSLDQGFTETCITQVKKIVPDSGSESSSSRSSKRRVSETIFCLVSVPIHSAANVNKDSAGSDQNNNEMIPMSLTVSNTDHSLALGGQKPRSRSTTDMPLRPNHSSSHFHTSSSTSSMRNYKRAPLRKEIIDAWALQANEDKELCYAGSWPGNQYRNQETQTSSPLTVKSPGPQSPPPPRVVQSAGGQPATTPETPTDTTDGSSSSYGGCPMAGQKNLHPSSNSAFCRLSLVSVQPSSSPPPPSQSTPSSLSSPSKVEANPEEQLDQQQQQPSSPRKSNGSNPADVSEEQVAFGQFLLKPVNRRPWDAIGELEYYNKEIDDTIAKRSNVEKAIEELEEVHGNILELSKRSSAHVIATPDPGRQALSLPPMHMNNSTKSVKTRSESWSCSADPDYREARSAFYRPSQERTNARPATEELPAAPEHSPRQQHATSLDQPAPLTVDPNQVYRQDIPVPKESLLRDVGLTVYTETPEGPGGTIQRSLSVPSPLDPQEEVSPSVELLWESRTTCANDGAEVVENNPDDSLQVEAKVEGDNASQVYRQDIPRHLSPLKFRPVPNLMIRRANSENSKPTSSAHIGRLSREAAFSFEDGSLDEIAFPDRLTYRNDSTMADKHLESLLIREKANSLPAEDLSNLYEVKCAKGIPENESIEQRAARILGIAVPVEALGVADRQEAEEHIQDDISINATEMPDTADLPVETETHNSEGRETQQVARESEQVNEESPSSQGQEEESEEDTGTNACDVVDHMEDEDRQTPGESHSDGEDSHNRESQQTVVLDLPEFPPSSLPLSLPVSPNGRLTLSIAGDGETKGRGAASKLIEFLQDKLNSSAPSSPTSSCRSSPERPARLKELDSVSRMRRLSLQSSGECCEEEADDVEDRGDAEECGAQVEAEGQVAEEEEEKKRGEDEENKDVSEDDRERCVERIEEAEGEEAHETEQPREEEAVEVELNIEEEESREMAISLEEENEASANTEESRVEVEFELKIEEDDEQNKPTGDDQTEKENARVLDNVREQQQASKEAERGEDVPRPKQRNRAQKPPLLPKPRSVPKREITLPLSFSSVSCGSSSLEDEEVLSVSDSYDPSRVERV